MSPVISYDSLRPTSELDNIESIVPLPQINKTRQQVNIPTQYRQTYRSTSINAVKGSAALLNTHLDNQEDYEQQEEYRRNLKVYGYLVIIVAWFAFIVAIGTIFNLWQWCFRFNPQYIAKLRSMPWVSVLLDDINQQNTSVVDNYYLLLFILTFVIMWIWAVDSWISMKLFRHSKGGGS